MFHEIRTNAWLAEEWLALREDLYFMELVTESASLSLQFINQFQIMALQYDYRELSTIKSKKQIMKKDSAHSTTNYVFQYSCLCKLYL